MSGERRERRLADAGVVGREARWAWLHTWWYVRDGAGSVTPGEPMVAAARRAYDDRRAAQDVADVLGRPVDEVCLYPAPGSLP